MAAKIRFPLQMVTFFALVGFIVELNSERAYWFHSPEWFWGRIGETLGVSLFYGFAAGLALWVLARTSYRGVHQVVLAGAVFAWTVEGVITPVIHEAGPFDPFIPAMFAGWHGLGSFVGLFYLVRRLLIDKRPWILAMASAVYGVVVGLWAVTTWLPDSDDLAAGLEQGGADPATPGQYALTMVLVVLALALGHLLLDRVWPAEWKPGRAAAWIFVGGTAAYSATWFPTIPYAPLRYGALIAIPLLGLFARAHRRSGPTFFQALRGDVVPLHLTALAPAALVSSAVYATVWAFDPDEAAVVSIRDLHVMGQMLGGGVALAWASWRAVRLGRAEPIVEPATVASRSDNI